MIERIGALVVAGLAWAGPGIPKCVGDFLG